MTEINIDFCRKKGIIIYKAVKVLALNSCINDLKTINTFNPAGKTNIEFMELIDEFQKPFLININRLIKRFITKSAGIMEKEVPVYETLVDNLMKELNCTKNIEILLITISCMVGSLREATFLLYLEMSKKDPNTILTEYNKILKKIEDETDLYDTLAQNILKIYKHNIIHKLTKEDIQNNRFIIMDLKEDKIISDLSKVDRSVTPMRTGF